MAERLGEAMAAQRTATALRLEDRGRDRPGFEQSMQPGDGRLGLVAQLGGERDGAARLALGVVDRALGDGTAEHLLEAERLGAELDVVVVPAPPAAVLVLDRQGDL